MIEEILSGLWRFNLTLGAGILLVVLIRKPIRRLFGAPVGYALWIIAPVVAAGSLAPGPQVETPITPLILRASAALDQAAPAALAWEPATLAMFALWLAGALATALVLGHSQARYMADLGHLEPVAPGSLIVRAQHAGIGPAVVGAFRPRIVTPADFEARFDAEERQVILAHESVHLARGDTRINAVAVWFQCLCWFNPLVHLAARWLRMDQEVACDATVLALFPSSRRLYAEVLLKTQLASHPLPFGCHWPARAEHPLKERIVMMKFPAPTRKRRALGLALVTAVGLLGAGGAWATQAPLPHSGSITAPDWAERPTGDDVARHYPPQAKALGLDGFAILQCGVDQAGRLEHCAIAREGLNPSDPVTESRHGFGEAALLLSQHFRMRPTSLDGAPTRGGEVRIPIRFVAPKPSATP